MFIENHPQSSIQELPPLHPFIQIQRLFEQDLQHFVSPSDLNFVACIYKHGLFQSLVTGVVVEPIPRCCSRSHIKSHSHCGEWS